MAVQPASHRSTDAGIVSVVRDGTAAIKLAVWADMRRLLRCFVFVPTGIFAMLAACYGVDRLLSLGGVAFPASVACLVLLFVALLLSDRFLGKRRTEKLVHIMNIPGGWSLRWLNLFFTPSFVMLPLSPAISAAEVGKMIAVFLIGFVVMMAFTAYMTRAIMLLHNLPRKSLHQRAEDVSHSVVNSREQSDDELSPLRMTAAGPAGAEAHALHTLHSLPRPPRSHAAAYITIRGQNLDDPLSSFSDVPVPHHPHIASTVQRRRQQTEETRARAELWAEFLGSHADAVFFASVLLLVGLPAYYSHGAAPSATAQSQSYAMPLQLSVNVLLFMSAMSLPPSWRQVLHPVLVSAFSTLLAIWLLARIRGGDGDGAGVPLSSVLSQDYRTGSTYLKLWAAAGTDTVLPRPGAGDVLGSILDASIVSLALPMFQYRHELRRHFLAIIVPNIVLSIMSLFAYPVVCHAIGINPERSLAFTSRSLTLALATPAVRNLGGDLNTVAAVALISGVFGVLIGRQMLSWIRVPEDDYVTRGVAFGANASALGTALLLRTDPRAAALSSLAMGLFGTVTVTFSSIPPMVHIIRSLVGLS